jgi:hypothetical protein
LEALHCNGAVLTLEQLADAPRHTGHLVDEDWHEVGTFGDHIRQARLLDMAIAQAPRDV